MNRLLLALSASALLSTNVMAADAASCQNVRMGVVNWTDVIATSAMTQVLLDGLGYKTKQTSASQQIIFAGMRDQRLDLFLGYWNPLMTQTITPFVDAKQVKVLDKPSLEDARATLAVPTYLADKGLKTFADIAKFDKELGGKIYGIEPGSGANTQIKAMIAKNQFGLGKFQLVESSEAGMLAAVDRAVRRKEAVVFFGWARLLFEPLFETLHFSQRQLNCEPAQIALAMAVFELLDEVGVGLACVGMVAQGAAWAERKI